MKKITLLFLIVLLFGCDALISPPLEVKEYVFPHNEAFTTELEIFEWIKDNIEYEADIEGADYWQSPAQTYSLMTGDIEDQHILLMYFFHGLGKEPLLHLGFDDRMIVSCDGLYYSILWDKITSGSIIVITTSYTYESTIHLSGKYHQ